MEDTAACAASLVLAFAGESSLRTACRELVMLAGELEHAARAANAPYKGLTAVAKMLSNADDTNRVEVVKMLEATAIALEQAAAANAARVGLPRDTLERPGQDLVRADTDSESGQEAISPLAGLGKEGTALGTLACSARRLARACQYYRRVADAIPFVRRAAAEAERLRHAAGEAERTRQQQRPMDAATMRQEGTSHIGRWWACLGRSRPGRRPEDIEDPDRRPVDIKEPLIAKSDPPTPSPSENGIIELVTHGQGDDKRSGMVGYGLFGTIGLIPYLGADKVAKKVELLSENNRLFLQIGVCLWWTLVAVGAPCSAYAHSLYERAYALFSSRLGILGMNVVVILFMYCVLEIDNQAALYSLLGLAFLSHVAFLILAFYRRHF